MEQLLSPRDAGRLLGISTYGVIQLDRRGRLRALRDSSGRRLFRRADVVKLLRERAARPQMLLERALRAHQQEANDAK